MLREYLHGEKASRVGVLMDGKTNSVFTNDIRTGERERALTAEELQEDLCLISRTYIQKPDLWYVLGILTLETGMGGKQTPRLTVTNVAY